MKPMVCVALVALLTASSVQANLSDCPDLADPASVERYREEAVQVIEREWRHTGTNRPFIQLSEAVDVRSCLTGATSLPECLAPLKAMADMLTAPVSSELDLNAREDERKRPPMEFLDGVDSNWGVTLKSDVETIAAMNRWPAVRYKSRHAGGFDSDTPSLLMIRVPGDRVSPPVDYDRYLNFALPADEVAEEMNPVPTKPLVGSPAELRSFGDAPKQFTIVTMKRKNGDQPAQVFFQKYTRNWGSSTWTPNESHEVFGCYSCHPNGLRAISPLGFHVRKLDNGQTERQMPREDWLKVKEMNDAMEQSAGNRMVSWRGPGEGSDFRPYLDPRGFGPTLGRTIPYTKATVTNPDGTTVELPVTRQKEFIMGGSFAGVNYPGCFNARPTVSVVDIFGRAPGRGNVYRLTAEAPQRIRWQFVRDAMNCSSCHGNTSRGAITAKVDYSQVDFKILVDQSMPHNYHMNPMDRGSPNAPVQDRLTADERIALANCLKVEFEQFERNRVRESLTSTSCQPAGQGN
jgi:hypothetical protein